MKNLLAVLAAASGAALTMYYFDPDMGRRRRAMLRQRAVGLGLDVEDTAVGEARHAIARARGVLASMGREAPQSDAQLRERIMARLGHLVSHPRGIQVQVDDGAVRLSGGVLAQELDGLLTQVRDMPGVKRVINAMSAHDTARDLSRVE